MTKVSKEIYDLYENGAGMMEIFEYIEDNTDLDPTKIIEYLFY